MKKKRFFLRTISGFWVFCLAAPLCLWASITNTGNDDVQVIIRKKSGFSQQRSLYPGQSIAIPERATHVGIVQTLLKRGDENIEIKVMEPSGTVKTLTGYGEIYELGSAQEEAFGEGSSGPLMMGKVVNNGNVIVDIRIIRKQGFSETKTVYLGQPVQLPKDTQEVRALPKGSIRGDEVINLSVTMPNGTTQTINRTGGIASLEQAF